MTGAAFGRTAPHDPLTRAIHAGCDALDAEPACTYPECHCRRVPASIRAALASIAEPSEGMIKAVVETTGMQAVSGMVVFAWAHDIRLPHDETGANSPLHQAWSAMHEKMMEEK